MAKLSKAEIARHCVAQDLLDNGKPLTEDEIDLIYADWHEGANNDQTNASAFFTPIDMAKDLRFDMPNYGTVVDLCAGTGRIAYYGTGRFLYNEYKPQYDRIICVEKNPDYVAVGKRLFPQAEWICGDALDPEVIEQLRGVDFAFANPPFGKQTKSEFEAPRYKGADFELKILDVLAAIAPEGWAIVPSQTAPFDSRHFYKGQSINTAKADKWTAATGLGLHRHSSLDFDYYIDGWNGVKPRVDLVHFGGEYYAETPIAPAWPTAKPFCLAPWQSVHAGPAKQLELI